MKTLIVLETWDPQRDGVIQFVKEYTKRYDATIFSTGHGAKPSKWLKIAGYPAPKIGPRYLRDIAKNVKEHDVIFLQGYPGINSTISLIFAKWYNKPVASYAHINIQDFIQTFLRIPKVCAQILFNVSYWLLQKVYIVFVPYPDYPDIHPRQSVTPLGVDIEKFCKKSQLKNKTKFVVGYCGRISPEKNVELLRNMLLRAPEHYELLIVGDGEIEPHPKLKVTGFVDDPDRYYNQMDIFIMPSRTETTSLATLEAMACELPVIVSKVGFMASYVKKNVTGQFLLQDSPDILLSKIQVLEHDPLLREQIGKNARQMVAYSFSWERSINRIHKKLNKMYIDHIANT